MHSSVFIRRYAERSQKCGMLSCELVLKSKLAIWVGESYWNIGYLNMERRFYLSVLMRHYTAVICKDRTSGIFAVF